MNAEQRVYIKGNGSRGDEVIKILTYLGGHNMLSYNGKNEDAYYFINPDGIIDSVFLFRNGAFPFIKEFYKEIKLPRWKPKYNERYYRINWIGTVVEYIWYDSRNDESGYKFGNCFRTKEEAEAARDKIKNVLNNNE